MRKIICLLLLFSSACGPKIPCVFKQEDIDDYCRFLTTVEERHEEASLAIESAVVRIEFLRNLFASNVDKIKQELSVNASEQVELLLTTETDDIEMVINQINLTSPVIAQLVYNNTELELQINDMRQYIITTMERTRIESTYFVDVPIEIDTLIVTSSNLKKYAIDKTQTYKEL